MRVVTSILCSLGLLQAACTRHTTPPPADPPARAAAAEPAQEATPPATVGALSFHESWPQGTSLDHPTIVDTADAWIAAIDGASERLDFAEFYAVTRAGAAMERVLAAIDRAIARGVRVRFLFDASFAAREPALIERLRASAGIELRLWDVKAAMGGVLHAKYFVIDGRAVILGSANFDWRSLEHIVELGARVDAPAIAGLFAELFARDWAAAGGEPSGGGAWSPATYRLTCGDGVVTVTPVMSPKDHLPTPELWDLPRILAQIDGARASIRIQLLSYQVTGYRGERFTAIDDALRAAAARGVEVSLLVADWNKRQPALGELQSLARAPGITVKMVTIPPASEGFIPYARVIHAKVMIVDDTSMWIGTSNFGGDYFYQSRNVGLLVDGEAATRPIAAAFDGLWASAYAHVLDPDGTYEAPKIGP